MVDRRAIQIGLRGKQGEEWALGAKGPAIVAIHDITEYVKTAQPIAQAHKDFPMPQETVLEEAVFPHLCCPSAVSEEEIAPGAKSPRSPGETKKQEAERSSSDKTPVADTK